MYFSWTFWRMNHFIWIHRKNFSALFSIHYSSNSIISFAFIEWLHFCGRQILEPFSFYDKSKVLGNDISPFIAITLSYVMQLSSFLHPFSSGKTKKETSQSRDKLVEVKVEYRIPSITLRFCSLLLETFSFSTLVYKQVRSQW